MLIRVNKTFSPTELAEWSEPEAGMFFWIKLKNTDDTFNLVTRRCIEKEIILLPGGVFDVIEGGDSSYIRASFSVASEQDMDIVSLNCLLYLISGLLNQKNLEM